MTPIQRWGLWLVSLGALGLVLANPNAFYKVATGVRSATAGSIVDVTTAGKGRTQY